MVNLNPESFIVEVHGKYGVIPVNMGEGSVGFDIALPEHEGNLLMPYGSRRRVDTGIIIKPPMKCFVLATPRSSSCSRNIRFSNTLGVIDPSYCGQDDTIKIDMVRDPKTINYVGTFKQGDVKLPFHIVASLYEEHTKLSSRGKSFYWDESLVLYHVYEEPEDNLIPYKAGERFCQLLFLPWFNPELVEKSLDNFKKENRGGYGSTGQK